MSHLLPESKQPNQSLEPTSFRTSDQRSTVPRPLMSDTPPTIVTKRRIKRIAPLQLGKMLAVLYGIMGLLVIPLFLIMSAVGSQMPQEQRVGMLAFGVGFALAMPLIYAAMGFVFGALGALIYNAVATWIGGIEVEVE